MTGKEFEKKIRLRRNRAAGMIMCGTAALILVFLNDPAGVMGTFSNGFYAGTGSALIAAGIVIFIRTRRLLKQPELLEVQRRKESDERNIYLREKAMVIAGYLMIFGTYFASLIAIAFNPVVALTLSYVICAYGVLSVIVILVLKKKY